MRSKKLLIAAPLAGIMTVALGASVAFASGPSQGSQVSGAAAPIGSYPAGAPFFSGQVIEIKIPANSVLKAGLRVNILECSDQGGSVANLPKNIVDCDGSTIQADTVLIQRNGSVDYKKYAIYDLPNTAALGEPPDSTPICNLTRECVLYIGQNQEDFTAPHFFSEPFFVAGTRSQAAANAVPPGEGGNAGTILAIVLPIAGVVLIVAVVFSRRRRARSRT